MDNILTNSFKFHHKWESKNKCLIILIISLYAETTSKGTCFNEGGECCTNSYRSDGKCITCPPGTYGDNCTTSCPNLHYGENCGLKCECTSDERCDPAIGCVSITTAPVNKEMTQQSARPILRSSVPHTAAIKSTVGISVSGKASNFQVFPYAKIE
ncbi:uncharacterized protein LOC111127630 [Crassostrea virginica]